MRIVKTRDWFLAFGILGIVCSLMTVVLLSAQPSNDSLPSLPLVFLGTFLCVMLFGFVLWLAARKAGYKNGVPIR